MFHKRSAGLSALELLVWMCIIGFIITGMAVLHTMYLNRSAQEMLKKWTRIDAPLPHHMTPVQRELIRKPVIETLSQWETDLGRCKADHKARIDNAAHRAQNAKNVRPKTAEEANAALKEYADAIKAFQFQQDLPPCRNKALEELRWAAKRYKLAPAEAAK